MQLIIEPFSIFIFRQKSPDVPAVITEKEETPVMPRKASKKRSKRISSDSRRRKKDSEEKTSHHVRSQSDQHKSSKHKSRGRTPVRRDANNVTARPGTAPMTSPISLASPVPQEGNGLIKDLLSFSRLFTFLKPQEDYPNHTFGHFALIEMVSLNKK